MTPQILAEQTKKHGISFLLFCALFWMNNRLTAVEQKLYDCLEDKVEMRRDQSNRLIKHEQTFAILPKQERYGIKRKMAV